MVGGQKIKLKGKFPESAYGTPLMDCVIVELSPSPVIVLSAEQLAKEYAANSEAAKKKYQDKYLRVTGEIVDRQINSAGAVAIYLKGADKVRVVCGVTSLEKNLTRSLRIGQQLTLVGQYLFNFREDEVGLTFCLPIRKE